MRNTRSEVCNLTPPEETLCQFLSEFTGDDHPLAYRLPDAIRAIGWLRDEGWTLRAG